MAKPNKKARAITLCISELVSLIQQSLNFSRPQLNDKLSLKDIKAIINTAFEVFDEELILGRGVRIGDIGALYIDKLKPRNGTNPHTRSPMVIPERLRVAFRPAKQYRNQLNKNWPNAFRTKQDDSTGSSKVD